MSSRKGAGLPISAPQNRQVLLLAGEPIDEPVFGYGPFVTNTREEIVPAFTGVNAAEFGQTSF